MLSSLPPDLRSTPSASTWLVDESRTANSMLISPTPVPFPVTPLFTVLIARPTGKTVDTALIARFGSSSVCYGHPEAHDIGAEFGSQGIGTAQGIYKCTAEGI